MLHRISIVVGLLVVLVSSCLVAGQASAPAATQPESDLKISLMDGSLLNGELSVTEFTVDTQFGTLKVPVDKIQSFTPGLESHPELKKTLANLVNDLGADTYAARERAQQAIMKMGPEIRGELARQAKSVEGERAARLQKILEDFEALVGDDMDGDPVPELARNDVIVTPGFVVVGRITTPGFSISSNYGTLQVKMEDVREGHREGGEPETIAKNVTVPGSSIAQRSMVNTGIKLSRGDQVVITASGSIVMTPWGSNRVASPDGTPNVNVSYQGIQIGTLVLRVGDGTQLVKAGSKLTWTADKAGILNLGIACPDDYASYTFPGEYQVKVRVIKK